MPLFLCGGFVLSLESLFLDLFFLAVFLASWRLGCLIPAELNRRQRRERRQTRSSVTSVPSCWFLSPLGCLIPSDLNSEGAKARREDAKDLFLESSPLGCVLGVLGVQSRQN